MGVADAERLALASASVSAMVVWSSTFVLADVAVVSAIGVWGREPPLSVKLKVVVTAEGPSEKPAKV